MSPFGEFVKNRRLELGHSLRSFCLEHEIDASNWSKMERGRLAPPQHEKLESYANYLNIKEGTSEWYELFDLAAAANLQMPPDLRDEEIARKLPVFFRTLRESAKDGGSDNEALLEELKAKIRNA